MPPSPLFWLFFCFSGSIGVLIILVIHWQWCLRSLIRVTNYTFDRYLDYKYRGYQCQIGTKPYQLTQIETLTPDLTLISESRQDDLSHPVTLRRDPEDHTIKYLHYCYGNEEYILPWDPTQTEITLPVYSANELETVFKMEYEMISVSSKSPHDLNGPSTSHDASQMQELHYRIPQFAGPKGNFYCDTPYRFPAGWLIDTHGHSFLSEQEQLMLFSVTYQTYTFSPTQLLVVSDSVF
jgi:hypothetical protein|uniref:Uncharacterized protein n=1 Tax=viral metagenome TaxID=1070528 RepID=A0A6C0BL79_9ZZZZ